MDFAREKFPGLEINLVPVHNDFFGGTVNVTGLLAGRDLVDRLSRENLGDAILLAPSMLMADEDIFLDDMTGSSSAKRWGCRLTECIKTPQASSRTFWALRITKKEGGKPYVKTYCSHRGPTERR